LGPTLLYPLPARRQGHLPRGRCRPDPLPGLARPEPPLLARVVPRGLRPRLPPPGRQDFPQGRGPPAPPPPEGPRRVLPRPAFVPLALRRRPPRRGPGALVPARLRRALLGPGPRLRPGRHVLVPPGGRPGAQQRRRHHRAPGPTARAPAGRR